VIVTIGVLFVGHPSAADKTSANADDLTSARDALVKFEKSNRDWKARVEALVGLAKIGPPAVPALVGALQHKEPVMREFAAQALVFVGDASARPALERALADSTTGVRIYAIQALSMLGPLAPNEQYQRMMNSDPTIFGVRPMIAAALERTVWPKPGELRQTLADYDLRNLDSARVGSLAPDSTLMDFMGKPHRLSEFRGKKTVVLRFILFDY
jgi:HEAT repeat protein